jgi:hypothetical protein
MSKINLFAQTIAPKRTSSARFFPNLRLCHEEVPRVTEARQGKHGIKPEAMVNAILRMKQKGEAQWQTHNKSSKS